MIRRVQRPDCVILKPGRVLGAIVRVVIVVTGLVPAWSQSAWGQELPAGQYEEIPPVYQSMPAPELFRVADGNDSIWTRSTLTGDWFGARSSLKDSGVTFTGNETQMFFGVDGGINSPFIPPAFSQGDTTKYTGRGQYELLFDLEKLGGAPPRKVISRGSALVW